MNDQSPTHTPGQPEMHTGRVLLADDDDQFRIGLGKRLNKAGFVCDFATSAAEVMDILNQREYDVLLSDINMPGNAGLEMIEKLPAVAEGMPVVLLTGNPTMATATRSISLRVTAYLTKPPEFGELCRVLQSAVAERQSLQILKGSRQRLADWGRELDHIQKLLQQVPATGRRSIMQSYLRLNLRNLVVGLIELENLLVQDGGRLGTDDVVQKQELLNAVRKTVGVLEKTREHFKSKELGDLRKELESLVHSWDGV